jgi:hypothetical protein
MHAAQTSDEVTTQWVRLEVDTDNTIPVELYSRPYERVEVKPLAPPTPPRVLVAVLCVAAFFCGFGVIVLLA